MRAVCKLFVLEYSTSKFLRPQTEGATEAEEDVQIVVFLTYKPEPAGRLFLAVGSLRRIKEGGLNCIKSGQAGRTFERPFTKDEQPSFLSTPQTKSIPMSLRMESKFSPKIW